MLFSTIVLRKIRMVPISGNHMHAFHTIWPLYPLVYIQPHQFQKKLQHHFPKIRRGGLKAVWSFSKNSFDLVAPSFPNWKKKRTQACAGYTLFTLYIILVSRTLDNLILCFSRQPVIHFFYFIHYIFKSLKQSREINIRKTK